MFSVRDLSIASLAASANYTPSIDLRRIDSASDITLYYSSLTTTSISITQECSMDNLNWNAPVDAYNATLSAIATVANGTAHSRFVQITPVYSPFMRLNVTATGTVGSIILKLALQES